MSPRSCIELLLSVVVFVVFPPVHGSDLLSGSASEAREVTLSPQQWSTLDQSVDRALEFLQTQQGRDGSFNSDETGQPGVTSLCVLAFLSRGHMPGEGPYGESLKRAIDFVLSKQRKDGLLFDMNIGPWRYGSPAHTGIYNHAIAGLMLSEVYGMGDSNQQERIRRAIEGAVEFTLGHQSRFNRNRQEQGGWRYLRLSNQRSDADLSITSWQLLFLRSARNAEFDVPNAAIRNAMGYVERCFDPDRGTFVYCIVRGRDATPAMAGAGIVSLSMGGRHHSNSARRTAEWMSRLPFGRYQSVDRYHYSAYYCSQAAFQMGNDYWSAFYPPLMNALTGNQGTDGSWERERREHRFLNTYSTSLAVLALTPPYQILPIYQR